MIDAVGAAGLSFDHHAGTGVVLHMLSGLGIDGRFGLTAFALDPMAAEVMYRSACDVIARTAESTPRTTASFAGRGR
ncbi:MAG: peptide ligase PGM1-related protein [Gammaproteobacteria bacterium]